MVSLRTTHTYAELEVPQAAYDYVRRDLLEHGYDHAFADLGDPNTPIDMTGIALVPSPAKRWWQWW